MSQHRRDEVFMGKTHEVLDHKTILIAGCGADGSHAAWSLANLAIHSRGLKLLLADPDTYGPENLGIQATDRSGLKVNKAVKTADAVAQLAPNIELDVYTEGVTTDNLEDLADVDYVIDATDISVVTLASKLHKEAASRGAKLFVPWSLGNGAAVAVCKQVDDFENWVQVSCGLAEEYDLAELQYIAQWLVDLPAGMTYQKLLGFLRGDLPTPTTYPGASAGGSLAAQLVVADAADLEIASLPQIYIQKNNIFDGLHHDKEYCSPDNELGSIRVVDIVSSIKSSLAKLEEQKEALRL